MLSLKEMERKTKFKILTLCDWKITHKICLKFYSKILIVKDGSDQWLKVTKYICSSAVLEENFKILALEYFCNPLHFQGKYCAFSPHYIYSTVVQIQIIYTKHK